MWNDLNHDGVCGDEPFFGLENFGFVCEWEKQSENIFSPLQKLLSLFFEIVDTVQEMLSSVL